MIYRLPEIEDKDIINVYVQEHFALGESSISASMGYFSAEYSEWVKRIHMNSDEGDELWGKSFPCLMYMK